MWSFLSTILGWFTGGTLNSILSTIDKHMDDNVQSEQVKADVTKTYVQAQANLLVGRTWWFQLLFVVPLGVWWTSVIFDSIFHVGHITYALPAPLDTWAGGMVSGLFLIDGSKAVLGRFKS